MLKGGRAGRIEFSSVMLRVSLCKQFYWPDLDIFVDPGILTQRSKMGWQKKKKELFGLCYFCLELKVREKKFVKLAYYSKTIKAHLKPPNLPY